MRNRLATVVTLAAVAISPLVVAPAADAKPTRGQFCTKAKEKTYKRYGLHCGKKDRNGRLHLI
jgi:hypothetical protein